MLIYELKKIFGKRSGKAAVLLLLMLVRSFGKFREYDYYLADQLETGDASKFYDNRVLQLKEWLDGDAKDTFSEEEKAFLIHSYESIETPFYYDYFAGWDALFEFFPTILMVTVVYWVMVLLYTGIVLGYLGADGAGLVIQTSGRAGKAFTISPTVILTFSAGIFTRPSLCDCQQNLCAPARSFCFAVMSCDLSGLQKGRGQIAIAGKLKIQYNKAGTEGRKRIDGKIWACNRC